jgi:transposase-like protein
VFDRLKSTREAARELGLNPHTCAGWVRRAGLKSHGKPGRALTGDGRSTPGCAILT